MDLQAVAAELLERSLLSSAEVNEAFARATDPAYWASLHESVAATVLPPDDEQLAAIGKHFETDGYFAWDAGVPAAVIASIRHAIEVVRKAGWPAVFAFVYDEPWRLYRSEALRAIARTTIGEDVAQTPYFWGHFVPPVAGARGWSPHADANTIEEPKRVTVWIAITDATLENGCMYVIPRGRMPRETLEAFFDRDAAFERGTTMRLLQSAKALPARSGSILGWEFRTVHWGSVCHVTGGVPRISISAEYSSRAALVACGEEPLSLDELPDFPARLRLIARAMNTYTHWDVQLARFEPLVQRLREWEGR